MCQTHFAERNPVEALLIYAQDLPAIRTSTAQPQSDSEMSDLSPFPAIFSIQTAYCGCSFQPQHNDRPTAQQQVCPVVQCPRQRWLLY